MLIRHTESSSFSFGLCLTGTVPVARDGSLARDREAFGYVLRATSRMSFFRLAQSEQGIGVVVSGWEKNRTRTTVTWSLFELDPELYPSLRSGSCTPY